MTDKNIDLTQIKQYTKSLFDIVKNDINASEYHFVMLLLVLQKEGILNELLEGEKYNLVQEIRYKIIKSNSKNSSVYERIWEHFEPIIARLKRITLIEIISLLQDIDQNIIQNNFAEIFDDLLYKHAKYQGRIEGDYVLPSEISQFLSNLVELPNYAKIYNPFAGLASFGLYGNENYQYLGQELRLNIWALGQLRIIAHSKESNCEFLQEDSIENWNPEKRYDEKFDLIIANPPFNARISERTYSTYTTFGIFGKIRNCEQFVIEKGIQDLVDNGKLITIVSNGFLFRSGSEQELRRYLVENGLLEMIISFPEGLLFNTVIPFSVVVINKYGKKDRGFVKFIDAKSTVENTSLREKRLNIKALEEIIKEDFASEYVRIIPNEAIAQLDYNLNVHRYFQKEVEGVRLNQFVTSIPPQKKFVEKNGKFVRIRDLKEDRLEYLIDLKDVEEIDFSKFHGIQKISESCLLLAKRWRTLKPTFFKFSGESIFITADIIALQVDESQIDITYLINELHADYVTEQINFYRLGATIPTIAKDDLLAVKIVLPSLAEQKAKTAGLIELSETIKALKAQNYALDYGLKSKNYDEYASLKHTLGSPRQNILSYADVLISYFEKNASKAFIEVNDNFNQELGLDLLLVFKAIKSDINFMSELLEKGEKGLILTDYEIETVPLTEVQNMISQYKKLSHKFNINLFPIKDENKRQLGIGINKALLRVVLDNLISNAEKHAYTGKNSKNQMIIDLKIINDEFIIDIKNNGNPFPNNFDKKKFTAKFSTANSQNGTGLGGYDIDRIITYFGAKWDLVLNEEIFPVRFVFQFPIISLS